MEVIIYPSLKKNAAAIRLITRRMVRGSHRMIVVRLLGMLISVVIFAEALFLLVLMNHMHGNERLWLLGGLYLLLVLLFLRRQSLKSVGALRYRPEGYLASAVRYVIEDDALVAYRQATVTRYGWTDFEDIEKIREFILLYLDRGHGVYMTREDFGDDRRFDAFYDELQARIKEAASRKKLPAPAGIGSPLSL
jgi:YcxB-like protein